MAQVSKYLTPPPHNETSQWSFSIQTAEDLGRLRRPRCNLPIAIQTIIPFGVILLHARNRLLRILVCKGSCEQLPLSHKAKVF